MKKVNKAISRLFKAIPGFSLMEIMVAIGLSSGLALLLLHVTSQSQKLKMQLHSVNEINVVFNTVQSALLDKSHCSANFNPNVPPALKSSTKLVYKNGITSIIDMALNNEYKKQGFTVKSMALGALLNNKAKLTIVFEKNKSFESSNSAGINEVKREMDIQFQLTGDGKFISCYGDISEQVRDAIASAVDSACVSPGLRYNNDVLDPKCIIEGTNTPPSATVIQCPANEFLTEVWIKDQSGDFVFDRVCKKVSECASNQFGIIDGSTVTCVNKCANDQVGFFTATGLVCRKIECAVKKYISGVDGSGNVVCKDLVDPSQTQCGPRGFTLRADTANGFVYADCCQDCINSSSYCTDQVTNTTNCETCYGSVAKVPYVWGAWGSCDTGTCKQTRYKNQCDNKTGIPATYNCCYGDTSISEQQTCYTTTTWNNPSAVCPTGCGTSSVCQRTSDTVVYSNVSCPDGQCCDPNTKPSPNTIICYPSLYNGYRTDSQCTSAGGAIEWKDGKKLCRFNGGSCPGGWAGPEYKRFSNVHHCGSGQWGTTCSGGNCCNTGDLGGAWVSVGTSAPSCGHANHWSWDTWGCVCCTNEGSGTHTDYANVGAVLCY